MTTAANPSSALKPTPWRQSAESLTVRDKLRKDLRYLTFYLSPNMVNFQESPQWFQEAFGLPPEESQAMCEELFAVGLWVRDIRGRVQTHQPRLGVGSRGENLTALETVTMVTQLVDHVSDKDNYCQTTLQTVVTSHEVKREFLSRMGQTIRNLLERSKSAPGETTLSFALITLDTMRALLSENSI